MAGVEATVAFVSVAALTGGIVAASAFRIFRVPLGAVITGLFEAMAGRLGYGELPSDRRREFGLGLILGPVVFGALAAWFFGSLVAFFIAAVFAAIVGANLVAAAVNHHRRSFERALPPAIDLLVSLLRSGRSIKEACGEVSARSRGAVKSVFAEAQAELELAAPPQRVFDRISRGLVSANGRMVFAALSIFYSKGGHVTEPLDAMAATFRELNKLAEKVQVASQEARSTFWLVNGAGLFMVFTILTSQPEIMAVYRTKTSGGILLVVATCLWALGLTVMGKMIRGVRL